MVTASANIPAVVTAEKAEKEEAPSIWQLLAGGELVITRFDWERTKTSPGNALVCFGSFCCELNLEKIKKWRAHICQQIRQVIENNTIVKYTADGIAFYSLVDVVADRIDTAARSIAAGLVALGKYLGLLSTPNEFHDGSKVVLVA